MTDQQSLFVEPHWTDTLPVNTLVHDGYSDHPGTVVANDGHRVTVEFADHPYHGTYRCTYGMDVGLRSEQA
jgi:hypothetical protein